MNDSGKRQQYQSGMEREPSEDKPRFDLIFPLDLPYNKHPIYHWAMVMTEGAKKYSIRNWEMAHTQEELERYKESAMRHFIQWFSNEEDENHLGALLFNLLGATYVEWQLECL